MLTRASGRPCTRCTASPLADDIVDTAPPDADGARSPPVSVSWPRACRRVRTGYSTDPILAAVVTPRPATGSPRPCRGLHGLDADGLEVTRYPDRAALDGYVHGSPK